MQTQMKASCERIRAVAIVLKHIGYHLPNSNYMITTQVYKGDDAKDVIVKSGCAEKIGHILAPLLGDIS